MLSVTISGRGNTGMELEPGSGPDLTKQIWGVTASGNLTRELGNANTVILMVGQLLLGDHQAQEASCILTHQLMMKITKVPLPMGPGL